MRILKKHLPAFMSGLVVQGLVGLVGVFLSPNPPEMTLSPWVFIVPAMLAALLLMGWVIWHYEKQMQEARKETILAAADLDNLMFKAIAESHGRSYEFTLNELLKFYDEHLRLSVRVDALEQRIPKS